MRKTLKSPQLSAHRHPSACQGGPGCCKLAEPSCAAARYTGRAALLNSKACPAQRNPRQRDAALEVEGFFQPS